MKRIEIVVVGAVLLFAACGGGDKAKLNGFKDRMCACKDSDCIKKVNDVSGSMSRRKKWSSESGDMSSAHITTSDTNMHCCSPRTRRASRTIAAAIPRPIGTAK